ncbi:MAG TPA: lipid A deacylase LpxR family protein, partial [Longimicrobiaceae bacterium]|nr:lipid A deacylase LpxR family protein [Longimicrobiaceae bacterium]
AAAQVRLSVDNDLFAPHRIGYKAPDWEYTAGTRLSWTSAGGRWWARPLGHAADSARLRTTWELGQEIYTPRHDAPEPIPGERPYAGWLYTSLAAEAARPGLTRRATVQLGVTGPPSLAQPVQMEIHRIGGFKEPEGWAHQLAFEPGIIVRYGETRTVAGDVLGADGEIGPEWEAALGNVLTGARAGLRARITHRGLYALGSVRGEWVAHSLFLDGNTFRAGPRVAKRPFVAQAEAGAGVSLGRVGLEYRAVFRGKEYETQESPHSWGSISLVLSPRRL